MASSMFSFSQPIFFLGGSCKSAPVADCQCDTEGEVVWCARSGCDPRNSLGDGDTSFDVLVQSETKQQTQ